MCVWWSMLPEKREMGEHKQVLNINMFETIDISRGLSAATSQINYLAAANKYGGDWNICNDEWRMTMKRRVKAGHLPSWFHRKRVMSAESEKKNMCIRCQWVCCMMLTGASKSLIFFHHLIMSTCSIYLFSFLRGTCCYQPRWHVSTNCLLATALLWAQ